MTPLSEKLAAVKRWTYRELEMAGMYHDVEARMVDASEYQRLLRAFNEAVRQIDACVFHMASDETTRGQIKAYREKIDADLLRAYEGAE